MATKNSTAPIVCRNDDSDVLVSIIALVVSLIALFGTAAQVLQQYYSSAAGYANCGESVMGKWHESKKRLFRPTELRFEVQFETPVVFVCLPSNKWGPIDGVQISFVRGTPESLRETRVQTEEERRREAGARKRVQTADNERATWVTLLAELHTMEHESQAWQHAEYSANPPSARKRITFENDHTLAVAMQPKRRSWDTMPANHQKPYATTAMCHLLEIAAMMGLHWCEFDRTNDRYRAEGNGYILSGNNVPDLGLLFSLQITGKRRFKENRVVPSILVKEMCCGYMSTIFRKSIDDRMLEFPNEELKTLDWLQVGSMNELAETLVMIGCNTNTANYLRNNEKKHGHLFPIAFELIGMLGSTIHIRNSSFRMLPNPTPYHWDTRLFSLGKLMTEFGKKLDDQAVVHQTPHVRAMHIWFERVSRHFTPHQEKDYALDRLEMLHDVTDFCGEYIKQASRELVDMVLREHFQQVLRLINDKHPETVDESDIQSTDGLVLGEPGGTMEVGTRHPPPQFEYLNAVSPEEKPETFMDIYFSAVLPRVMRGAVRGYRRCRSSMRCTSSILHSKELSDNYEGTSPQLPAPAALPSPRLLMSQNRGSTPVNRRKEAGAAVLQAAPNHQGPTAFTPGKSASENLDIEASNIWCTLVFRMLCWLMLHDFHWKDVQIPKSELLGSRLPVYLA